jgi:molybdopterin-containing oxidoreductase family membrane subunit
MFLALFLLFLRFLPCINIAEVKWTLKESDAHDEDKKAHPDDGIEVIEAYQYELHENPEGSAREAGIEIEKSTAES